MSKSITSDNGVEITVGLLALEVTDPVSAIGVYARLSPGQRCALADALRGREPGDEYVDWKAMYEQAVQERDALNTRHPKPQPYDQGGVRGADSLLYRAERERDAAVARAEQAEKRRMWPKTTPTGHTYVEPRTYEGLCHEHDNAAQAAVECWEVDECPPEPTWEMVGIAHREVERLQRECDEMRPSYDESVSMAYWAAKRLGCHVDDLDGLTLTEMAERVAAQPAPEVTRDDIENAIRTAFNQRGGGYTIWHVEVPAAGVCDLLGIGSESVVDPAVLVVRESNVEAQAALRNRFSEFVVNGTVLNVMTAEDCREKAQRHLDAAARCEAIARAIEAEAVVDPVEEKARELAKGIGWDWDVLDDEYVDIMRSVSVHVLGQEANNGR